MIVNEKQQTARLSWVASQARKNTSIATSGGVASPAPLVDFFDSGPLGEYDLLGFNVTFHKVSGTLPVSWDMAKAEIIGTVGVYVASKVAPPYFSPDLGVGNRGPFITHINTEAGGDSSPGTPAVQFNQYGVPNAARPADTGYQLLVRASNAHPSSYITPYGSVWAYIGLTPVTGTNITLELDVIMNWVYGRVGKQ